MHGVYTSKIYISSNTDLASLNMSTFDPIALLFGGREQLGPGDNFSTVHVLNLLPSRQFRLIVDAGCGTGRQTLALAKELRTPIHAIDTYQPFLDDLVERAKQQKIEHLVHIRCMDMKDIPQVFNNVDLLWSEGAAYNIGFVNALAVWRKAIVPNGFAVVSELCWLTDKPPDNAAEFFKTAYPDMQSLQHNLAVAEQTGYQVLTTYTLPRRAWLDGYYDVLGPRAKSLLQHSDAAVRDLAAETIREIEIFDLSQDSYGYVFFVLQRNG
jgi:SAM-dependent methyltransferase